MRLRLSAIDSRRSLWSGVLSVVIRDMQLYGAL